MWSEKMVLCDELGCEQFMSDHPRDLFFHSDLEGCWLSYPFASTLHYKYLCHLHPMCHAVGHGFKSLVFVPPVSVEGV